MLSSKLNVFYHIWDPYLWHIGPMLSFSLHCEFPNFCEYWDLSSTMVLSLSPLKKKKGMKETSVTQLIHGI